MKRVGVIITLFLMVIVPVMAQSGRSNFSSIINRRLPAQDTAKLLWDSIPVNEKSMINGQVVGMSIPSNLSAQDDFHLTVLFHNKSQNGEILSKTAAWRFSFANRDWQARFQGVARGMDRIEIEMFFWSDVAASFPNPGNAKLARMLYQRLLNIDRDLSFVSLRPTTDVLFDTKTGKIIRSIPARPDQRNIQMIVEQIKNWKLNSNRNIGITMSQFGDAILWVNDGRTLWGFHCLNERNQWRLLDWEQADPSRFISIGCARLCTINVKGPVSSSVGGAGTAIRLTDIDSTVGQLLTRFFRLCGLNNKDEVFAYFKNSVPKTERDSFWQIIQTAVSGIKLEQIFVTTQKNGQIVVSIPTQNGQMDIKCEMVNLNRFAVNGLSKTPVSKENSVEKKVRMFVRDAIIAAQLGDARKYCVPPNEIISRDHVDRSDGFLINRSKKLTGQYYLTAYKQYIAVDEQSNSRELAEVYLVEQHNNYYYTMLIQVDIARMLISDFGGNGRATLKDVNGFIEIIKLTPKHSVTRGKL